MENSRPYVILSAAISVDGKIATKTGDSALSSRQDKIRVHRLRAKSDAILVGKNTVVIDDPLLTVRHAKGKSPKRIVLDSNAEIPIGSKIIRTSGTVPTIVVVSENAPKKNLTKLEKYPVKITVAGKNRVDLKKLLQILRNQQIRTLLLEGGGTTNWEFVHKGLVDEIIVAVTPYLVGGSKARTLVDGEGFSSIVNSLKLKLHTIKRQNNEIVLHYYS